MPTFKLKIKLGNDAMNTSEHIVGALRDVSPADVRYAMLHPEHSDYIYDENGNCVGLYKIVEDEV